MTLSEWSESQTAKGNNNNYFVNELQQQVKSKYAWEIKTFSNYTYAYLYNYIFCTNRYKTAIYASNLDD